jgi:hypothetical protein
VRYGSPPAGLALRCHRWKQRWLSASGLERESGRWALDRSSRLIACRSARRPIEEWVCATRERTAGAAADRQLHRVFVKRMQATARVAAVPALPPAHLYERVGHASAVTSHEFDAYLGDLSVACGVELTDVRPVADVALDRPGPQSWRYLFADEPEGAAVFGALGLTGTPATR